MSTLDKIMMFIGYGCVISMIVTFVYVIWHIITPQLTHPVMFFLRKKKRVIYRFPNGVLCRVGYIVKDSLYDGGYAIVDAETKKTHSINYVVIVDENERSLDNMVRFN